jgi:hypothetical protein
MQKAHSAPQFVRAKIGRMFCTRCGYTGPTGSTSPAAAGIVTSAAIGLVGVVFWPLLPIAGFVFFCSLLSVFFCRRPHCAMCKAREVVPYHSPVAQQFFTQRASLDPSASSGLPSR